MVLSSLGYAAVSLGWTQLDTGAVAWKSISYSSPDCQISATVTGRICENVLSL